MFVCSSSLKSKYLYALLYEAIIQRRYILCDVFRWIDAGAECIEQHLINPTINRVSPIDSGRHFLYIPTYIIFIYVISNQGFWKFKEFRALKSIYIEFQQNTKTGSS